MPRIAYVTPAPNMVLNVRWSDGRTSGVNLIGWVSTGGPLLAPLLSPQVWETAAVTDFGATVEWAGDDLTGDDLAIDAWHLHQIAEDQREFTVEDLHHWQDETGLSNNEAADFLGVSLRTWKNYRAGAAIGTAVKMLLRASQRDPLMMHAHYRPRRPGRPAHTATNR